MSKRLRQFDRYRDTIGGQSSESLAPTDPIRQSRAHSRVYGILPLDGQCESK
jgi:hypothetical protein